ncbi:MAG: hypothetical protein Aurels2KO_31330 [Aureliella sp.]
MDFEKWPHLSVEKLESAFTAVVDELTASGFEAKWCLTGTETSTALEELVKELNRNSPDIVVVGAGVRTDPDHLILFEQILNKVIEKSPHSKIAFNTLPFDTVDAVKRWA